MKKPQNERVKNSSTRIATIATGLESLTLLVPNNDVKRILQVLAPGISYCSFIIIRHIYKRYVCTRTVKLLSKYLNEAEDELRTQNPGPARRKELLIDIAAHKFEIKAMEKDMIMVEFR